MTGAMGCIPVPARGNGVLERADRLGATAFGATAFGATAFGAMVQKSKLLPEKSGLFAASPAMRAMIEKIAVKVSLPSGSSLFTKGDGADSCYILDQGEIEISVTSVDGKKLSIEILTPPDVFGEIGLFAGRRTADATTLSPTRLRRVRRNDLLAALRTEPDLALQIIDLLCARLRSSIEKLEERAFMPLPARLARRLLHLADTYAAKGGVVPLSQAELADFAGATREAVAKTLAVWKQRGWIGLSRGAVKLLDRAALEVIAASVED
jgi:CRP-like cAMP-binding protein